MSGTASNPYQTLLLIGFLIAFIVTAIVIGRNTSGKRTSQVQSYQTGGVIFPDSKCQCYCSDLCGPRDIKHGIDRPFVDQQTGLCFCADRDKVNYIPNRCTPKSFPNSCCG